MGFIGAPRGAALSTIRPRVWRTDEAVSRSEEWLNARYLRLDTTNDPLTDTLETRMLKASADNVYDIGEVGGKYRDLNITRNWDAASGSTDEDYFFFTGNSDEIYTGFYVVDGGGGDAYFGITTDTDFTKWVDLQTNVLGNKAIIATNFPYLEIRTEVQVPHVVRANGIHPHGPNDDLGRIAPNYRWRDLHLYRNLTDDTNTVTVANLKDAYDHEQTTHDYAFISGNDAGTNVTAAELEELTDTSETVLHSHAGLTTDEKVKVDAAATADYLGIASNDGALRTSAPFAYTDGGNFVTLSITQSDTSTDGYLSSTDWNTFNGKSDLALGEASTDAYRGDRGKTAYDHSQVTHDYSYISGNDAGTDITAAELEDLSDNGDTTIHGHDVTGLTNWPTINYAYVSGNDAGTGITAAELEELSDGSSTTLHTHAGIGKSEKWFGDGSDGSVAQIGGTLTLTRDMYYSALSISSNAVVETDGFRIFCTGTLSVASGSVIDTDGGAGGNGANGTTGGLSGGVGGAAGRGAQPTTAWFIETALGAIGGTGGGVGVAGDPGGAGGAVPNCIRATTTEAAGTAGGAGGGAGGAGGGGGAGGVTIELSAVNGGILRNLNDLAYGKFPDISNNQIEYWNTRAGSGAGGGGGGGQIGLDASGSGGGGGGSGGNGGILFIAAKTITNAGVISANGGAGGTGGDGGDGDSGGSDSGGGGGAGGSGGQGGAVVLCYNTYSGAGTKTASAGAAGTGGAGGGGTTPGNAGNNGNAGTAGLVLEYS